MLNGQKILFIGVDFYHYNRMIVHKLENTFGSTVTYYPERDTGILYGIVNRIFPNKIDQYQEFYYKKLYKKLADKKFDYFFVIRGFKMPLWFVKKIKANNPIIKTIYYQWDSNTNSPFMNLENKYDIIEEFTSKLSFDYKDVKDFPVLKYLPTFYTDGIEDLKTNREKNIKYDLFYFGSYLPERYKGLVKFMEFAKRHNYVIKLHFYMPWRYYIIERLKGTKIAKNLIKTSIMSSKQYLNLLDQSRCVVDVSNEKQTGLAMRVIDCFGASKKVITTNKWIIDDQSYDPTQTQVIDIDNIDIPDGFLKIPIKNEIQYDYSLEHWIKTMFNLT